MIRFRVGSQNLLRARETLGASATDDCFVPAARTGRCAGYCRRHRKEDRGNAASREFDCREENAIAALEVMSRFPTNPKRLVYLTPTMSPSEISERHDLLEHPAQAFGYFRKAHVETVIYEQKHMGSSSGCDRLS